MIWKWFKRRHTVRMGLLLKTRKLVELVYRDNPQVHSLLDDFSKTSISTKDAKETISAALDLKLIKEIPSTKGVTTPDYDVTYPRGKYLLRGNRWLPVGVLNEWLNQHKIVAQILVPALVTILLYAVKWKVTGEL